MYSIAQLQEETGATRRTIHFYVQQGILPPPVGAGPRAAYDESHRLRLLAVRRLQEVGWRLDQIRAYFQRASLPSIARVVETGRPPPVDELEASPSPATGSAASDAEPCVRYRLAPGIELLVSANAPVKARATVERSLPLIAQLFRDEASDTVSR